MGNTTRNNVYDEKKVIWHKNMVWTLLLLIVTKFGQNILIQTKLNIDSYWSYMHIYKKKNTSQNVVFLIQQFLVKREIWHHCFQLNYTRNSVYYLTFSDISLLCKTECENCRYIFVCAVYCIILKKHSC